MESENKSWEFQVILNCQEEVERILETTNTTRSDLISILTLGCPDIRTLLSLFSRVLESFRKKSEVPVALSFGDVTSGDWSFLLTSAFPMVYFSLVPHSFYEQMVPGNSVDIVFSSFILSSLSKAIDRIDGILPLMSTSKEVRDTASKQSVEDMGLVLQNRYKELRPGGFFVFFTDIQTPPSLKGYFDIIAQAHERLFEKKCITAEEKQGFKFEIHHRRREEWHEIFGSSSSLFRLIHFEIKQEQSPFYLEYLKDNDTEKCLNNTCEDIFSIIEKPFLSSLKTSEASALESFMKEIKEILTADPNVYRSYSFIILEKI